MSKKKKQRHNQQQAKAPGSSPIGQTNPLIAVPAATETPAAALAAIAEAHNAVVAEATEEELNVALATPPPSDASNLDLIAAKKLIHETFALLKAKGERVARREEELAALEKAAQTSSEKLNARATDLDIAERKSREAEKDRLERELAVRERELNAEAGFATQRRASLKQLDDEVATLREELSKVRAKLAQERADWEADRSAEDLRMREQIRIEREQLSKERTELKNRAAQVELEQDVLREDREGFDERVARRAAHELEAAKAKQMDIEARLASAQKDRDVLYEKLRLRDEAERALGNRPLDEVKKELDSLIWEREFGASAGGVGIGARPAHTGQRRRQNRAR